MRKLLLVGCASKPNTAHSEIRSFDSVSSRRRARMVNRLAKGLALFAAARRTLIGTLLFSWCVDDHQWAGGQPRIVAPAAMNLRLRSCCCCCVVVVVAAATQRISHFSWSANESTTMFNENNIGNYNVNYRVAPPLTYRARVS
jgi:hypothetical protein